MKKSFKRILAFALCLAFCMSMLPTSVFAGYGTLSSDNKTIQNESLSEVAASSDKVTTEWGDIPENWHGFVMRYSYDEDSKLITVDTGLFNTPYSAGYSSYLKFDADKLQLLTKTKDVQEAVDNGVYSILDAATISKYQQALLTEAGTTKVKPTVDIIGATNSLYSAFTDDTSVVSSDDGDINATFTSGAKLATEFAKFLDSGNQNVRFPSTMVVPLYSVSFSLKDGYRL